MTAAVKFVHKRGMQDKNEPSIDMDEGETDDDPYATLEISSPAPGLQPTRRSWPWVVTCLAVAAVSILYRVLVLGQREQSALMFIGLPLLLAIFLSLTPRPKSATGMIMKGMSLSLLLFGVLLIEGIICILMAAPLFFLVGFIVGWLVDRSRRKNDFSWRNDHLRCTVLGTMALMSFEGVTDWLSFDREEKVQVSSVVVMSPEQALKKLAAGPSFEESELPPFLNLGFPQPVSIEGQGMEVGSQWTIHMAGGEGEPGDLVVKVVRSDSSGIRLERVKDGSHIAHWLDWKSIEWQVEDFGGGQSLVTMTMEYDRLLDPAWYFKPVERYGVKKAGEYFISQTFKDE